MLGLLLSLGVVEAAEPVEPARIATLDVPGPKAFVKAAREVVDLAAAIDPSIAANAGLFDDAVRVPRYDPASVRVLEARLDKVLAKLAKVPWATLDVHTQVDLRWVYAVAETQRRALVVERAYTHRPGQWLEPVSNDLIALASYAPERPELQDQVLALVPAMVAEMRTTCAEPTRRDIETGIALARALSGMAASRNATAAVKALDDYAVWLGTLTPTGEFTVIGADNYRWRLERAALLPWDPDALVARAEAALAAVDAELATIPPPEQVPPTDEQRALAAALDRDRLLAMYDAIEDAHRAATIAGGWVSIPDTVGPIRARETPDALVPLTGDGGSMNPPPTFGASNVGYWNVEHFRPEWTEEERVAKVRAAERFRTNQMGPYAAHEGYPGHHLQLAIARSNPDPLRSILADPVQNEGWGLYAEEAFQQHGGLGDAPAARANTLRSYRFRILRVATDVKVETGAWTLEQAAIYKYGPDGEVDEDVLRAINWPTQLVCYFAGKAQIVDLFAAWRAKNPDAPERAFHDAFLAAGSIPIALIRAELLGEPVPPIPSSR
ncbi:MAG: DUF885 family protein [Myxococcota bacterium]